MCGIAGWVSGPGGAPDREVVVAMTRALAHRGPDFGAVVLDGPAALGHRRLSVLDLSAASNQPMWDATGRYLLVYNGEIYNYREIRSRLENEGHTFETSGDSEVLLVALREWGPAAFEHFVGMFALAVWDKHAKRLLLARDRLGKKPLFFARCADGGIAFASEPRALAAHPQVSGAVDAVALAHYLRLNYVPCNRTLFSGVESIPPGCYAELDGAQRFRITRYWHLANKFREKRTFPSEQQAAEELRALIDDAVRLRLVSDVPLGAFLSSGVDSSTVVASMLQHRPGTSVLTFSSGFVEDSFDESSLAEELAGSLGAVHHTQTLDPNAIDLLPAMIATSAEPLADTSSLPMYFLSRFTRQHVTVALSGDGGDECFAGYETYVADKLHRMARFMPRALRARAAGVLDRLLPVDHRKVGWPEKLRRFSGSLALDFQPAHASWRDIFSDQELARIMLPGWRDTVADREARDVYGAYFAEHFDAVEGCDPVDQATYVDIKTWLVDDILVKADRMSMAHSLEVRCPLLDHRIVEFAAQLPANYKLRGFSKKHVLRASQRTRLPQKLLDRPKRGFNAPVSQWVLGRLREMCQDNLHSQSMRAWFDAAELQRLWTDHEQRRRDNGLKLFGLLTVALFLESVSAENGASGGSIAVADRRAPPISATR